MRRKSKRKNRTKRRGALITILILVLIIGLYSAITISENNKIALQNAKLLEELNIKTEKLKKEYEEIKINVDKVIFEDESYSSEIKEFLKDVDNKGIEVFINSNKIEKYNQYLKEILLDNKNYLEKEYNSIEEKNSDYYSEEESLNINKLKEKYLKESSQENYNLAKIILEELKSLISEVNKVANKRKIDKVYDEKFNEGPYNREIKIINDIIIVNKEFGLPADYSPGEDYEAREAFEEMKYAANLEGIYLEAFSTYRGYYSQYNLYYNYVYSYGEESADTFSARPGFSEHQTGLAFDIGGIDKTLWAKEGFKYTSEYEWLSKNAYKYGFIERYPEGKEWLTGYIYESWHFRYIGKEHSINFKDNNLTLEEYLDID